MKMGEKFAIMVAAATLVAGSAHAEPQEQAPGLSRSIASAAAGAEQGLSSPEVAQQSVTVAVQGVIIASASSPKAVLASLDEVLAVCQSADPRLQTQWSCPRSASAFAALNALRTIVVAQLEQPGPAAIGTRGFAAFGSVPTVSAGAAGYKLPSL